MIKRYAVIVGVTEYEDDQLTSLLYTKNDALRLAELLVQYGGFERKRLYVLADGVDEEGGFKLVHPTRSNVLQKVKYVAKAATPDDLILFFFAGHGAEVSKHSYLLTSDTKLDVLQQTAVNVTTLNKWMEQSKASCVVRLFDACRSPFGAGRSPMGRMTDNLQNAMLKSARGWASFSGCSSGEQSHEQPDLEHGVFSYYVCEGLDGKAANENGQVTFDRLVDYVRFSLANWSDEQTLKQTPHVQSDLSGVLVLTNIAKPQQPSPVPQTGPLETLRMGLGDHLSRVAEDARNLAFTTDTEHAQVLKLAERSIMEATRDFADPCVTLSVGGTRFLGEIGGQAWSEFQTEMRERHVKREFKQVDCVQLSFTSSEIVVPHTAVTIAVARFSFFYWIWHFHECLQSQLQGTFTANPPFTKGFLTLKPKAALDSRKIDACMEQVLNRVSDDVLMWAEQLRQYVEGRLGPLRDMGDIVD